MYKWPTQAEQPTEVQRVITLVRQAYPEMKWTRLLVTRPADDDGIWFFWLPDQLGEVQIESSFGVCPFIVETDKHNESITGADVREVAEKIVEWLGIPGGHAQTMWHPR